MSDTPIPDDVLNPVAIAEWARMVKNAPTANGAETVMRWVLGKALPALTRAAVEAERERIATALAKEERAAHDDYKRERDSYQEGRRDAYDHAESIARAGGNHMEPALAVSDGDPTHTKDTP